MQLCKTQQEEKEAQWVKSLHCQSQWQNFYCLARHGDFVSTVIPQKTSCVTSTRTFCSCKQSCLQRTTAQPAVAYIFCNLCITKCTFCDAMVKPGFGYALICACGHQSERLALEKIPSGVLQTGAADT